jgi:hypothetical protein
VRAEIAVVEYPAGGHWTMTVKAPVAGAVRRRDRRGGPGSVIELFTSDSEDFLKAVLAETWPEITAYAHRHRAGRRLRNDHAVHSPHRLLRSERPWLRASEAGEGERLTGSDAVKTAGRHPYTTAALLRRAGTAVR